jgi:hypothetical protein
MSGPSIPAGVGEEGVAVDLEGAGVGLAGGAGEGVDGWADVDVGESGVGEHLVPALTGQPTGDSTGPQVDVAQHLGWYGAPVGDVGELEHAAGAQHPVDLVEHGPFVGA